MAEQASSTALVPVEGEYQIEVSEFTPAGTKSKFMVPVPSQLTSQEASVMLRAAILKRTTWKQFDFPTVLHAVIYSDRMGLDIMAGDVYMAAEGRISTTAGAKIRHAMSTDRIVGYEVQMTEGPEREFKYEVRGATQTIKLPNWKAKITVHVRGWTIPVVYETELSEWFVGTNPNWRTRPSYMLRKNALSKAMEEVAPLGIEADEAPPLPQPQQSQQSQQSQLTAPAGVINNY